MTDRESDRRYTDREVALVLKRAAELEERRRDGPAAGLGLTLFQLREVAREVGFSPEIVNQAVADLQTTEQFREWSLLGRPVTSKLVRALPRRLTQQELPRRSGHRRGGDRARHLALDVPAQRTARVRAHVSTRGRGESDVRYTMKPKDARLGAHDLP